MSQSAFLRTLDDTIVGAFADAGMADVACWRGKRGGAAEGIRVIVDHGVRLIGTDGGVVENQTTVTLFRADLPQEASEGDKVTVNGVRYQLAREVDSDESRMQFAARELE